LKETTPPILYKLV